jgi:hypothetical protein
MGELNWSGDGYKPSGSTFVHRFEFVANGKIRSHSDLRPAR